MIVDKGGGGLDRSKEVWHKIWMIRYHVHCNSIQDKDIINTTFMLLIEPENYNRKPIYNKSFGRIKTLLNELQPFQMLFTDKNITKMYFKDNILAMFSNLEKLDMVSNAALQSLVLVSAITLTMKKPEWLKIKMPSGTIQGLRKTEIK